MSWITTSAISYMTIKKNNLYRKHFIIGDFNLYNPR